MTLRTLINRTILRWQTWKHTRSLPELGDMMRAERKARAKHGKTAHIARAKRELVHQQLKMETSR